MKKRILFFILVLSLFATKVFAQNYVRYDVLNSSHEDIFVRESTDQYEYRFTPREEKVLAVEHPVKSTSVKTTWYITYFDKNEPSNTGTCIIKFHLMLNNGEIITDESSVESDNPTKCTAKVGSFVNAIVFW